MHLLLVVASGTVGIDAIPEELDLVVTLTEEGEVECQLTGISVGQRTDIPIIATPAS